MVVGDLAPILSQNICNHRDNEDKLVCALHLTWERNANVFIPDDIFQDFVREIVVIIFFYNKLFIFIDWCQATQYAANYLGQRWVR